MKMNKWTLGLAALGLVSLGSVAQAEEKTVPLMTAISSTTLSGYVDTSAVWNPGTGNANPAPFSFNAGKQDGFNVNAIGLTLDKPLTEDQWAAGYHVDFVYGPDAGLVTGSFGTSASIKQAYVTVRAPLGNGLDFKLGQFDTIIGYEVFESFKNPNFTRSYAYTIEPTEHTGLLASYQVVPGVSLSAGVADTATTLGINTRSTRAESHKAYLGSVTLTAPESWGAMAGSALYVGIIDGFGSKTFAGVAEDQSNIYIGATINTPLKGLKVGASYDQVRHLAVFGGTGDAGYAAAFDLYASFQVTDKLTISSRAEYAKGNNLGAALGGTPFKKVLALTGTVDYSLWQNVISRLEVRWDHAADASKAFGGTVPGTGVKHNDIMLAADLVYKF